MNSVRIIIILLFNFILLVQLPAQIAKKQYISAQVVSRADSLPISFAHVVVKNLNKGLMCSESGYFACYAPEDDTLLITALGFKTDTIAVIDFFNYASDAIVTLLPQSYSLKEVIIVPYKNYKELKDAFLALKLPQETEIDLNIPQFGPESRISAKDGIPTLSMGSPITALYNAFSKEGKELAEYKRLMERKSVEKQVEKKYNKDIVAFITGINDERKVLDFMEFCKFSDDFILQSNDYQIYLAINNCYKEFCKLNKANSLGS